VKGGAGEVILPKLAAILFLCNICHINNKRKNTNAMLESLLKKPSKRAVRELRKRWKNAGAETAALIAIHPQHAVGYRMADMFSFADYCIHSWDSAMLDEIAAEAEATMPDDLFLKGQIRYSRARMLVTQHKFQEAALLFEEAANDEKAPNRSSAFIYLIELYEKLKEHKNAARWVHLFMEYRKIEGKSTNDCLSYSGMPYLLSVLANAGEYENVIRIGKMWIEQFRRDAYVYFLVGQSYLERKDDLRALHYFTKVQKLRPNKYPSMYQNLGGFYWNEHNDLEKAIEYTLKAAEICGDNPKFKQTRILIYQNLAMFYKLKHDLDKAGECRRKQFEAMGSLELFDLVVLYGGDQETMNEFAAWAENHPEIYDKYFERDEEDEDTSSEEDED
jgi:tetratricopeptide (TPR) repeat protein